MEFSNTSVKNYLMNCRPSGYVCTTFDIIIVSDEVYLAEQSFYPGVSCFLPLDREAIMKLSLGSQLELPNGFDSQWIASQVQRLKEMKRIQSVSVLCDFRLTRIQSEYSFFHVDRHPTWPVVVFQLKIDAGKTVVTRLMCCCLFVCTLRLWNYRQHNRDVRVDGWRWLV